MDSSARTSGLLKSLQWIRRIGGFFAAFVVHCLALQLGTNFVTDYPEIRSLWPASGAALALVLVFGYRAVLPICLSFILCSSVGGIPPGIYWGDLLAHLLSALLCALLLRRIRFSNKMESSSDFFWLMIVGPLMGSALYATLHAHFYSLAFPAYADDFSGLWTTIWASHAVGILVMAPLLMVWMSRKTIPISRRQGVEGMLALSLLFILFSYYLERFAGGPELALDVFIAPILIWIYFMLGSRGLTLATLVLVLASVWPFFEWGHSVSFANRAGLQKVVWMFLAPVSLTNLLICAFFVRRKWQSEAASAKDAWFQALLENTTDIVTVTALDGTILYESPSIERILGYTPKELIGVNAFDLVHPEDVPGALAAFMRGVRKPGDVEQAEIRYRHKDGRWRVLEARGANHVLNPSVGGVIITSRDITERRATDDRLRGLSVATEQSPVSVVITDARGNIEYVNVKFEEVTGYRRDEVLGQNPRLLKSGELAPEVYKNLWETISSGITWRGEFHNRRKDGELFWESATISPLKDAEGRITHYLAVKEDVTEKKAMEAQVHQSQKMEAVGQLAGGVAHDFNNLLTIILGYCDFFLQDLQKDSPMYTDMQEMKRAGERAAVLTRHLLAFSRRQVFQPRVIGLNDILLSLDKMMRRFAGEDVELVMDLGDGLPPVRLDPTQIEQVIINIVANARDAMSQNGKITFTTRLFEAGPPFIRQHPEMRKPGQYVSLEIADNGSGMSPAVLSRAFEPFFTTKPKGKGTGLGLSMVYGIIKQSNGFIYVQSQEGQGTTFQILFPPAEQGSTQMMETGGTVDEKVPTGTETILVVEDESVVRGLAVRALSKCGYHVLESGNGSEAWHLLERPGIKPDLVLTDVIMPLMGGRELGTKISEKYPNTKVIYMSGYTDERGFERGDLRANEAFIQKPFTTKDLAMLVRRTLDRKNL